MKHTFNFDLDGTLVDLYNRDNWLDDILAERLDFSELEPLVCLDTLNQCFEELTLQGHTINVLTWTPCDVSDRYVRVVKAQKKQWVADRLVGVNKIVCCQYGQNKKKFAPKGSFLLDDNVDVLEMWGDHAIDVNRVDLFDFLTSFIKGVA